MSKADAKPALFADLALARRLEAADVWFRLAYAEAQARLRPNIGTATKLVGEGCVAYAGPNSPLNRALGLGMSGPVGRSDLEQIEAFLRRRESPVQIEACSLADPSLAEQLERRGYRVIESKNVWFLVLEGLEPFPPPPPNMVVRAAELAEGDLWVRTVSQGFYGRQALRPEDLEIAFPNFYMSTATCFLAWLDGEPIGGGAMATYQGLAKFFSASTRPGFRRRGGQTALLHARLNAALAAGCDLAVVHTVSDTPSQRNVARLDFRLAHTRSTWLLELDGSLVVCVVDLPNAQFLPRITRIFTNSLFFVSIRAIRGRFLTLTTQNPKDPA